MIFVDFADATSGGTDPQALYDHWVPQARDAFTTLSRGRFDVDVTPYAKWVRMPAAFTTYGFGEGVASTYDDHHGFIAKAIAQVDPEFDFSTYSTVYVVTPPSAALRSAADVVASGEPFNADGHDIGSGVTLGTGDPTSRSHTVFLHETGHLLGLPDLYPYDSSISDFVGPWDIMAYTYQPGTPMTAWTRLLVGWLDKSEIRCVRRTTTARLTAVTARGGTKALAMRTGRRRVLVVEARTDATGTFCRSEPGVLIYSAAVSAPQGGGPIRVADPRPMTPPATTAASRSSCPAQAMQTRRDVSWSPTWTATGRRSTSSSRSRRPPAVCPSWWASSARRPSASCGRPTAGSARSVAA